MDGLKEDRRNRGGPGYMIYHGKQRSRDSVNTDERPGDGCGLISILAYWVFLDCGVELLISTEMVESLFAVVPLTFC